MTHNAQNKRYSTSAHFVRSARFFSTKKGGFTLIEALVAILIFTSALIIFGTMLSHGISSITNARSELQAYLFASEGIEALHQVRDSNRNTNIDWLTGIASVCDTTNGCKINAIDPAIELAQCSSNGCDALYANGIYFDQSGLGDPLSFVRTITVSYPLAGSTDEIMATSLVRWVDSVGRFRDTKVTALMHNWQ